MIKDDILRDKSYKFSLRIIKLNKFLQEKSEFVLSKQVLKSGTAIGAMVSESKYAQSKLDFINKLSIALKEANETKYWIDLLVDSEYITKQMYDSINPDIEELLRLLISSINTLKNS
ncbi:MAG: four helix bundle protein [Arcobacteraceae bacterium]|jgi:four helix bundle protein|nr:four helix bundle protein [Arcobacteraceae bacterium]MDY0327642.1 four helix bundle protein [Arcobacteraceae bacterium]